MNVVRRLSWLRRSGAVAPISVSVHFVRDGSGWLTHNLQESRFSPPKPSEADWIEARASETDRMGAQPLWEGYAAVKNYPRATGGSDRRSEEVRSSALNGRFFTWLAAKRRAMLVVEFGSAFGISGMYWLSGLKHDTDARLLTFEPNAVWANIAKVNLAAVSSQFDLVQGTFEENIESMLPPDRRIDIAFVDAIHTSEFVFRQFAILLPHMDPGGLILFDDIDFSPDMVSCWETLSRHPRVRASAAIGRRLGIVELDPSARA